MRSAPHYLDMAELRFVDQRLDPRSAEWPGRKFSWEIPQLKSWRGMLAILIPVLWRGRYIIQCGYFLGAYRRPLLSLKWGYGKQLVIPGLLYRTKYIPAVSAATMDQGLFVKDTVHYITTVWHGFNSLLIRPTGSGDSLLNSRYWMRYQSIKKVLQLAQEEKRIIGRTI